MPVWHFCHLSTALGVQLAIYPFSSCALVLSRDDIDIQELCVQVAPWEVMEEGETAAQQQQQQQSEQPLHHVPFCVRPSSCHMSPENNHGQQTLIASPLAETAGDEVWVEPFFSSTFCSACYFFAS